MKKVEDYRAHAEECRQLAASGDVNTKQQLLAMAETWDSLAGDREKQIARQERIKALEGGRPADDVQWGEPKKGR